MAAEIHCGIHVPPPSLNVHQNYSRFFPSAIGDRGTFVQTVGTNGKHPANAVNDNTFEHIVAVQLVCQADE